ncbi:MULTISPECIES: septum site-determining protein MinC [unclassified Ligilactobacillus]|uniref:septum site-determining protein MinC n=1 Tax=unclassified Ligilactobacillus TaxID=2767920 RepID=UPI0038521163
MNGEVMKAVSLKGYKDRFELVVHDTASFTQIKKELADLLAKVNEDKQYKNKEMTVTVQTGMRQLTTPQEDELKKLFKPYPLLSVVGFKSTVVLRTTAAKVVADVQTRVDTSIVRSGQDKQLTGDVLFMGTVHDGGTLRAEGNIYALGALEGIICAGTKRADAVIVGDLSKVQQVRIGTIVAIIADEDETQLSAPTTVAFVEDETVKFAPLIEFLKKKPEFFAEKEVF